MKLVYIAFVRMPTEKAHGIQIMKTCEALARSGVDVTLVVPGRTTHEAGDPFEYYRTERVFSLVTSRVPDLVRFGTVGFLTSMILFSERVKLSTPFWSADVIYSRDAGILLQYMLLGKRLVYEAHTKPTILSVLVARLAYKVVVISEGLRDAYIARGIPSDKIVVAHDAALLDFTAVPSERDARRSLGIPENGPVAMYIGRVDASKGVPTLAAASAYTTAHIVVVGDGPLKATLTREYPRVQFVAQTPYDELPRVMAAASVLVIPNSATNVDTALYTSPMKLFAYLASKKPIAASDVPAIRSIAHEHARYATPDDPRALAEAIDAALQSPPEPPRTVYSWEDRARTICQALAL